MNIFKVLSSYDGKINEPNISAFWAYLLNPSEDHGIGYLFLNEIVKLFDDNEQKISDYLKDYFNYDIKVIPEYSVDIKFLKSTKHRRDIDIVIEFYKSSDKEIPDFSICIENKISDTSFNDLEQIYDEILGLEHEYDKINKGYSTIYFLLICPTKNNKIEISFSKEKTIKKQFLLWKNSNNTVIEKLQTVLKYEKLGLVDPFSTEIKYLIKAFMSFAYNDFQSGYLTEPKKEKNDYGRPVVDYLNDIYKEMENDKDYTKDYIKNILTENIKESTGKLIKTSTRSLQLNMVIVNEITRTNHNIKNPIEETKKNLFYYPDENNKEIIRKFTNDIKENIDIYWVENGEKRTEKLSKIIKELKRSQNGT
jgi:hypothetical protein